MLKIKTLIILFLFLYCCKDSKDLKNLRTSNINSETDHIISDSSGERKTFKFNINDYYIKKIGFKNFQFSKIEGSKLKKVNLTDEERKIKPFNRYPEYFYYSVLDTTSYYSVLYYYTAPYESCLTLVNYTKSGKYIDSQDLISYGGDEDYYQSNGKFLNDSTYIKQYEEGRYLYDNLGQLKGKVQSGESVIKKHTIELIIQKKGRIKVDTLLSGKK